MELEAARLTLGRHCSYNETYRTLKIEWYGVVVTLGMMRATLGVRVCLPRLTAGPDSLRGGTQA